jgi:hypothetical protein
MYWRTMANIEPTPTDQDPASALTIDLSHAARVLRAAGTVDETLAQVTGLSVVTIEGCDFAGIFLLAEDPERVPVYTDPVVIEIDALQRRTNEGPCLDAATGVTVYAGDLSDEPRWPAFAPGATAMGVRSMLALPLYARYPQAFGVIDRARGLLLAALASLAFSSARIHEDDERRATNLHAALATREVIGQAQGILMERERITADQAFDVLRRASQHLNRKLREVAEALVQTGERPDTGPPLDR